MEENKMSRNNKVLNVFKYFFSIIALLTMSSAIYPILLKDIVGSFEILNSSLMQLMFIIIYLVSLIFVLLNIKKVINICKTRPLFWILLFYIIISSLWSDYTLTSIEKVFGLIGNTVFSIYLVLSYSRKEILKLLIVVFSIIIFFSYIYVVVFPDFGMHTGLHHYGAWKGVFTHKNVLGRTIALSIILNIIYLINYKKSFSLLILVNIVASYILLFESHSITSLIITFLILPILVFSKISKYNRNLFFSLIYLIGAMMTSTIILLFKYKDELLQFLGRDPTLTGRTLLWETVVYYIKERPLLGYGYQSFWLGSEGIQSSAITKMFNYEFPHAHNGILDLIIQIGIVGSILFLILFLKYLYKEAKEIKESNELMSLTILLYIFFINISESNFIEPNTLYWTLFVYIIFTKNIKEQKTENTL